MDRGNSITHFLRKWFFSAQAMRENLWALLLAFALILIFTCAMIGVQPKFVYTGF